VELLFQNPPGPFALDVSAEGVAQRHPNGRVVDALGAEFLFDPARSVAATFGAGARPIAGKIFVPGIARPAQLFQRLKRQSRRIAFAL
jgi:hypothetical protein